MGMGVSFFQAAFGFSAGGSGGKPDIFYIAQLLGLNSICSFDD
jgi:hypothetical protein